MRSKVLQQILSETPAEVGAFVRKYGDIVVRIHQLLKDKGITQKELADRMDKSPSEISKWLSGNHNLTLRSITKLETELGEEIINVPKRHIVFSTAQSETIHLTVFKNETVSPTTKFVQMNEKQTYQAEVHIA